MKNTRDLFRENLREIITRRGLKLDKAAELCEISLSGLNQILSGKSAWSPETIDKICVGLSCRPSDLFLSEALETTKSDLILDVQGALPALNEAQLDSLLKYARTLSAMDQARVDIKKNTP